MLMISPVKPDTPKKRLNRAVFSSGKSRSPVILAFTTTNVLFGEFRGLAQAGYRSRSPMRALDKLSFEYLALENLVYRMNSISPQDRTAL